MTAHANHTRHHPPTHEGLHPLVYRSMIGLAIWLVLSVWVFFSTGAYFGLTLSVITLFFVIIMAIPLLLWITWRHNAPPKETRTLVESFRDWASEDFATWTGGLNGREAAMQILLPIAAVSIGMTVFGLVYVLDGAHPGY
jgi:hypothetical protein